MEGLRLWWGAQYAECSLRDPGRRQVFRSMWESHGPFRQVSPNSTQHLWYIDNCKILEIYTPLSGEKAGHDRNSDTLFYEFWCPTLLVKTWLCGELEWGEVLYRLENVQVRWRKGTDSWLYREKDSGEAGKVVETMRTVGDAYWVNTETTSLNEKTTKHYWNDQKEQGNSTLIEQKDTTSYEESITSPTKVTYKHWLKGPKDLSKGHIETIEGGFRSINLWEIDNNEGSEIWEKWEGGKLVWSKEKRKRGEGWELIERENWDEQGWKGLSELLKTVVSGGNLDKEVSKVTEKPLNSSSALAICTELATLLHMELNTLRRNQITTQEVLGKLSFLAAQLSPGSNGISLGEDIGEQLANTLETLAHMEKTLIRRKEAVNLGEEMEEFPSKLQQCFFLGLDLLSQVVPSESDSPASELLRSTQWMRQNPPLDSNTNRLMLVNFLKSALGLTMKQLK